MRRRSSAATMLQAAATATRLIRRCWRRILTRQSIICGCPPPVAPVMLQSRPSTKRASMAWLRSTGSRTRRSARIATASTVSWAWRQKALPCPRPTFRSASVALAIRTYDWAKSTDWPRSRSRPTKKASTAWQPAAAYKEWRTAQAVTVSITSSRPAIRGRTSTRTTWRPPAASAMPGRAAASRSLPCT